MAEDKQVGAGKGGSTVKAVVIAVALLVVLVGALALFSNVTDLMLFDY